MIIRLLLLVVVAQLASSASAVDWKARRAELVTHLFGTEDGALPSRSTPDDIEAMEAPIEGCLCAARGNCKATDCQWTNNMTKLTWTLESKLPQHSDVKVSACTHALLSVPSALLLRLRCWL
jgi:hypothetical protein